MRLFGIVIALALSFTILAPLGSVAQTSSAPGASMRPSKEQIETALKATNPSLRQMKAMKPMLQNYKSQTASAPDQASKTAATETLMSGMKSVLSPSQQATFKQSLLSQMQAAH